ncbi:MAG TPA: hypothetical protein ENJ32_13935 [Crenotrichaceae bacterium]|nr:hypothetical protein [Crenotrichaceae bacterium]
MKSAVSILILFIPLAASSSEYVYKAITLDIPSCEVVGGGIANMPPYNSLLFRGKDWYMIFNDVKFTKNCLTTSEKRDKTISCDEQNRIKMLDKVSADNSKITQVFFASLHGDKITRQEFNRYILYSSAGLDKYSIAILVEKETGKTTEIEGKFSDEHLKWLRLEPL